MNYSIDIILDDLKEEFSDITFSYEEINYEGKLPCFFIEIENKDRLAEIWMKVSDIIAVNYQSRLSEEFSIWNIYLFFLTKTPIENELKYLIENDTFSSRKIVVDEYVDFKSVIEKYILNTDIIIESTSSNLQSFTPNSILFNQVQDIEVKTRITNPIKDAYSQIVKEIKNRIDEI
jgi:5'(3')-deoxyribonucleotidase